MNTRRQFIGGLAASGLLPLWSADGVGREYSVSVLGDVHYDAEPAETYHAAFIRKFQGTGKYDGRFFAFKRNGQIWAGPSRRIVEASAKCVTDDTAFVLQLGDIIQGDCEDPAVHRKMLSDAVGYFKGAYPARLPFVTVCGNHDIRDHGQGAARAYKEFMPAFEAKELGDRMVEGGERETDFVFRQGPDLYFVFNFNDTTEENSRNAKLKASKKHFARQMELLKAHKAERYTFVILHSGVFPFENFNRRWFCLGALSLDDERRAMRAELARRNAILIVGHTHLLEFKDAQFPEGRLTEMTMNTVLVRGRDAENPAVPQVLADKAEDYGKSTVGKKKVDPEIDALMAEYSPFMKRYFLGYGVGHARLRVSDGGVEFDYYGRDALEPTKTFKLR